MDSDTYKDIHHNFKRQSVVVTPSRGKTLENKASPLKNDPDSKLGRIRSTLKISIQEMEEAKKEIASVKSEVK